MYTHEYTYWGWNASGDCYHLYFSNRYDIEHLRQFLRQNDFLVKVICESKKIGFIEQLLKQQNNGN